MSGCPPPQPAPRRRASSPPDLQRRPLSARALNPADLNPISTTYFYTPTLSQDDPQDQDPAASSSSAIAPLAEDASERRSHINSIFTSKARRAQEKDVRTRRDDEPPIRLRGPHNDGFVLRPDMKIRRYWDMYMFLILVYLATVSVFVYAFLGIRGPSSPWFWIERFVDVSFAIDVLLNFFTAYERAGALVTNRRAIRIHYLRTWFVPDLITTFPWDVFALSQEGNDPSRPNLLKLPRFIRLIRLFKLIRLTRIIRLKKGMTRLEVKLRLKYGHIRLVGLFLSVVFSMHLFACFFYFFGSLDGLEGSWVAQEGIPTDLYGRYISALYFSVYTITTIGYGDVVPENTKERSFTTVFMFLGAAMFAYIISQVSNIAGELTESSANHRRIMDSLTDFAKYRQLPDDLVFDIRRYFQRDHLRQRVSHEQQLLKLINRELRIKVLKHMFGTNVEKSRLFRDIPEGHLDELYGNLSEKFARKDERLYSEGDAPSCFYIIAQGSVELEFPGIPTVHLGKDDIFGENDLLFNRPRHSRAISSDYTELIQVPRQAVMRILVRHPRALQKLRDEEALWLWGNAMHVIEEQIRYKRIARELRENATAFVRQRGIAGVRQDPPIPQRASRQWRALPPLPPLPPTIPHSGSSDDSDTSPSHTMDNDDNSSTEDHDEESSTTAMRVALRRKTVQVSHLETSLRELQKQLDSILEVSLS